MAASRDDIKTYVLMDLETTGLAGIGETPRIVEMCFLAVSRKSLVETNRYVPRIVDKLVICVNPCGKPMTPGAAFITGLYNDVLENLSVFDENTAKLLSLFLDRLPKPVCMLAHNGHKFDFPMLKMELERVNYELPDSLICADTLEAFRVINPMATELANQISRNRFNNNIVESSPCENGAKRPAPSLAGQVQNNCGLEGHSANSDDEVTPVKPLCLDGALANPPPAPRKKRNLSGEARNIGNVKTAKRRLLQEDLSAPENGREFLLGSCATSPPPSPRLTNSHNRSAARRRLAFNSGATNSSGEGTLHDDLKCSENNREKCKENGDFELMKFPDDFDDDKNAQDKSDNEFRDGSLVSNSAWCSAIASQEVNEFTSSLPDEDLVAAVDRLVECDNVSSSTVDDSTSSLPVGQISLTRAGNNKSDLSESRDNSVCGGSKVNNSSTVVNSELRPLETQPSSTEIQKCSASLAPASQIYSDQITPKRHQNCYDRDTTALSKDAKNEANQEKLNCDAAENVTSGSNIHCSSNTTNNTGPNQQYVSKTDTASRPTQECSSISDTNQSYFSSSLFPSTNRMSFKLPEIYKRVFGHPPRDSHTAEDDCITLLKIIQSCANKFGDWVDQHVVPFSEVIKMY